jgi:beta-N-acetylhexosaminidase
VVYLSFLSGAFATIVVFFKLYHSPGLDAFRLTLPGILLLGRYFSLWDILAYWTGIALAAVLDSRLRTT